jgi:hypothetical protein
MRILIGVLMTIFGFIAVALVFAKATAITEAKSIPLKYLALLTISMSVTSAGLGLLGF